MGEISLKQKQILEYIRKYISQNSKSPTLQEISETCEMESRAAVHYHIQKLIDGGYISRGKNTRDISLREALSFSSIPIYGVANAGQPLSPAEEDYDLGSLQIDSRIAQNKGNLFAVKISGDSMNKQYVDKNLLKDGDLDRDTKAPYKMENSTCS
jgi:repressor LexA